MDSLVNDIPGLRDILGQSKSIAVVGLSSSWFRPSYFAAKYMIDHGYEVYPVNPAAGEILGRRCYAALSDVPRPIEIVDCFRKAEHIPQIAAEAVAVGAKVLWLQLGVVSREGADIAAKGGLKVVMDRCVKIEHGRLFGGLGWFGVNTKVISSRRRPRKQTITGTA